MTAFSKMKLCYVHITAEHKYIIFISKISYLIYIYVMLHKITEMMLPRTVKENL